jgi:hypothetical protein
MNNSLDRCRCSLPLDSFPGLLANGKLQVLDHASALFIPAPPLFLFTPLKQWDLALLRLVPPCENVVTVESSTYITENVNPNVYSGFSC